MILRNILDISTMLYIQIYASLYICMPRTKLGSRRNVTYGRHGGGGHGGLMLSTFASHLRGWWFDSHLRQVCTQSLLVLVLQGFNPSTPVSSVQRHAL